MTKTKSVNVTMVPLLAVAAGALIRAFMVKVVKYGK